MYTRFQQERDKHTYTRVGLFHNNFVLCSRIFLSLFFCLFVRFNFNSMHLFTTVPKLRAHTHTDRTRRALRPVRNTSRQHANTRSEYFLHIIYAIYEKRMVKPIISHLDVRSAGGSGGTVLSAIPVAFNTLPPFNRTAVGDYVRFGGMLPRTVVINVIENID